MPLILHIPHASVSIPFLDGYVADEPSLKAEIGLLTDWFTDELFDGPYVRINSPVSRIFCDMERFSDDALEVMASRGMGMCYEKFDNDRRMREVTSGLRDRILKEYYQPHHKSLEEATAALLRSHGTVQIIDCHSFTDRPLKRDLVQTIPRPDFCLGTHKFHTPSDLVGRAETYLRDLGYTVGIDTPYAGTLIPTTYFEKDKRVQGMMIEVNRKLYMEMDGNVAVKNAGFEKIKRVIGEMLGEVTSDQ
jgi:N-formylglutamate deformylase